MSADPEAPRGTHHPNMEAAPRGVHGLASSSKPWRIAWPWLLSFVIGSLVAVPLSLLAAPPAQARRAAE